MYFLSLGISPAVSLKIYKQYGQNAVLVCRSDPYRLADEIRGVGFLTADYIAGNLGYAPDDPRRLQSGIRYVLTEALNGGGHTFLPMEELLSTAEKALKGAAAPGTQGGGVFRSAASRTTGLSRKLPSQTVTA